MVVILINEMHGGYLAMTQSPPPPPNRAIPSIASLVHKTMASSPTSVVVVHFVAGSKTGIRFPSVNTLTNLQGQYGERLVVSHPWHWLGKVTVSFDKFFSCLDFIFHLLDVVTGVAPSPPPRYVYTCLYCYRAEGSVVPLLVDFHRITTTYWTRD